MAEDINYQSTVTNNSSSQRGNKQRTIVISLAAEIIGLIIIFAVFLMILNYFKIISLSSFLHLNLNNLSINTQNKTNATIDSSGKITGGPTKKTIIGKYYETTSSSLIISRLTTDVNLVNFTLDSTSVFNQIDPAGKILDTYPNLDSFKKAVATDKDKFIKVYYLKTTYGNLAITASLCKQP